MKLAWIIACIAVVGAGYFGFRAQQAEERADRAESVIANQERLRKRAESFQPAQFVRVEGTALVYRSPRQVVMDDQTFVNYIEERTEMSASIDVFGPTAEGSGQAALARLSEGAAISILLTNENLERTIVEAVYIAP